MSWTNKQRKRTYQCWCDMKQRCYNQNCAQYKNYGGRGIVVCERWVDSFDNFIVDMGEKPEGMTIDRVDVNGNYEPSNCRWLSNKEQQSNRRNNVLITHNGQTMTQRQWAAHLGINELTLNYRIKNGYPIDMALSTEKFKCGHGSPFYAAMAKGE